MLKFDDAEEVIYSKKFLFMHKKYFALGIAFFITASISIEAGFIKNERVEEKIILKDSPELYNFINDGVFEKLIIKLMKIAHMPSLSALIIKDNEILWSDGFGLYDMERNKEADEKTIYLVASISKTITATALMQLYEKGYFDLDDNVNNYLPFKFRNPNYPDEPITFRMLLAHQSSLAEDPSTFYAYIPGDMEVDGYPYPWLEEYLTPDGILYIPHIWSNMPPGEEMQYANVGYGLLGYLVETISGMKFEKYCSKNIFEPLGMENTSFRLRNLDISRVAVPYSFRLGEYYPFIHYGIIVYPAGGLRTNVVDLSHFLIAHMNGGVYNGKRILSEESVEEMHRIQYQSNNYGFQYGLGFQIWKRGDDVYIGHTGGLYGVTTKMVFRESDKIGIIFFTNKQIINLREMIAFSLIEQLLFWKATGNIEELKKSKIEEAVLSNIHIIKNFDNNFDIEDYLPEIIFDIILR